jgi:hypothetical protein
MSGAARPILNHLWTRTLIHEKWASFKDTARDAYILQNVGKTFQRDMAECLRKLCCIYLPLELQI